MISVSTPVSAFGVFLPVLASTFGWTRGAISMALSINMVLGGFAAFAIAHVADRRGPRGVLAVTVLIGGIGLALMSRVGALWQVYLCYGVMVGIGFSSVYVLTTATVSRWFEARRGLALGVVLSGYTIGWLVGGPFAAFLIDRWGWRIAYVVLGLLVVGVGVPACLGARFPDRRPPRDGEAHAASGSHVGASLRGTLRDRRFWLIGGGWSLSAVVYMMVPVHTVPFARDHGLPLEQASFLLTAYGLGAALGRLAGGLVADRLGTPGTLYGGLSVQALALAVLLADPPAWALSVAMVAFGLGTAGADNAFVKVIPEVFGVVAIASVTAVIGLGWRAGAALGPAAAGFAYDLTRSYTLPFTACFALLAFTALLFHLAVRRS
jgi:MFS family permease